MRQGEYQGKGVSLGTGRGSSDPVAFAHPTLEVGRPGGSLSLGFQAGGPVAWNRAAGCYCVCGVVCLCMRARLCARATRLKEGGRGGEGRAFAFGSDPYPWLPQASALYPARSRAVRPPNLKQKGSTKSLWSRGTDSS